MAIERGGHPPIQEREKRPEERERIDQHVRRYGEVLARFDEAIFACSVGSRGELHAAGMSERYTPGATSLLAPLREIFVEREVGMKKFVQEIKRQKYVLDAAQAYGALMVTFNASQGVPRVVAESGSEGDRGFYRPREAPVLGVIGVDVSAAHRADGVTATTTLVHELHHHARAMTDLLLMLDPALPFASGSFYAHHIDVAEKATGRTSRSSWERVGKDARQYDASLGRRLPVEDQRALYQEAENIGRQQAYLDELHSSFLQRKAGWFHPAAQVYSRKGKGLHHELVGSNTDDVAAAKNLFCYAQGMHLADRMYQQPLAPAAEAEKFAKAYIAFGATLGAARGVQQAERLASEHWGAIAAWPAGRRQLERYVAHIDAIGGGAAGKPAKGGTMKSFLLGE